MNQVNPMAITKSRTNPPLIIEEKRIEEVLSYPILLSDRLRTALDEANYFTTDCSDVVKLSDKISDMLKAVVRLCTSSPSTLYERPIRRIVFDVTKNLERAFTLIKKCKKRSFLHRVVNIVSVSDFRKVVGFLDSSCADMKWLLSIFDGGIVLSLPPIASNDPILSWVWSYIASIYSGSVSDKVESANELASLAKDNDRNKKIIVEEGGVVPLLKLLKENSSPEGQVAAAVSLCYLANEEERVRVIVGEAGVSVIVQVLGDSPMRVQIYVAKLVALMAEHCQLAQEDFARENVIRPLVTSLSFDIFIEDMKVKVAAKQNIHTLVQINKELERKSLGSSISSSSRPGLGSPLSMHYPEGSNRGGNHRKDREYERPEVKLELKVNCAKALWMLARNSLSNSKKITETKGLLCLAKLVEKEHGELQVNCLMTIMEITTAAESNADLRRAAFKANSPAAKAVVDQLLRIMKECSDSTLLVPAIRAIGSLARTFPARETRVIGPLVEHLSNRSPEVAAEAAEALGKFVASENYLHVEHSKTIIDFNGVPPLMKMLRSHERAQLHAFILLCHLASNVGENEALEQARVLNALEGVDRALISQHPELKELIPKARYHLNVYHSGMLSRRQPY
ncbi:hypothetical protein Leryth_008061 [Lithospermum erythrorhizon]|uniref:DUF7792 domain-containing protein n=1 Tax=Lithospermum erythrorhizon TaxID=34254 RepID=A0AAV3R1E0_LITER|nr:hypothetical protein Leryth_008061 [Lithospermum erythrorhizon]